VGLTQAFTNRSFFVQIYCGLKANTFRALQWLQSVSASIYKQLLTRDSVATNIKNYLTFIKFQTLLGNHCVVRGSTKV
jgi:hypothetical protein